MRFFFFHTQYNFRDLLKLLCKGICYALSLCKVKALLGFQNLHAYGSNFGALFRRGFSNIPSALR